MLAAVATPEIQQALTIQGVDPEPGPPEAVAERIKADIVKWKDVVVAMPRMHRARNPRPARMRKLSIIGIGAGNPDHITVQAIKALATVDVIFLIDKGDDKDDLAELRKDICARYIKKPYPDRRGQRPRARPRARRLRARP